ncbi:MAG: DUF433 domain-containing protein [Deltaproteobacteria bacterium]|nr:DUF433 domain-containing protein [Deltaproteobacteria bacterium]
MNKDYVTQVDGAYRITDTRISLDSVVYCFLGGQTPESIVQSFPLLTLEQVYGAIAFYLAHRAEIDAYLEQGEVEFEALRQQWREQNLPLHQKLMAFREQQKAAKEAAKDDQERARS